jgi:glc operon protein GlcG
MRLIRSIGHAEAEAGIAALRAELERRQDAAIVAIADAGGDLLAFLRLDGAPLASIGVAINKAYTAARLRRPTRAIGDALRDPARGVAAGFYADDRTVGWAGGLPVLLDGAVIGAVGVSGMSQDLDEEMAGFAVAAILAAVS